MKGIFLFAGIAGVVLAVVIYYMQNKGTGQVINVEDGFPVDAY
jgi:hypothetical protein